MEALTPEDVAILDLESSTIAGHTCKVVVVEDGEDVPTLGDVRAHVAGRLPRVARLCQRLLTEDTPCWADPQPVAIEDHVRLAPNGEDLAAVVGRVMAGRLDRSRPLWDLEVVPHAGVGHWALVWRVHHALADGMTMMRWASQLLWDEPPEPPKRQSTTTSAPPPPSLPRKAAAAARTAVSLGRELRPVRRAGAFAGQVGERRQAAFAQCSLDDLRAIEHGVGAGVTVNDVVLGAVAGAMRSWCVHHDAPLDGARVKVPVSMHVLGPDVEDLGNRDSFMFVDLPVAEADPVSRLLAVNRETRDRKTHHDAEAAYDVLAALQRMSPRVAHAAQRALTNPREFTVNVSNVPGPRSQISVLGRPVRNLYSFAEVAQHHPVRVAAVSLCHTMQFGILADPDVVPGVDVLAGGLESSVGELLSACG